MARKILLILLVLYASQASADRRLYLNSAALTLLVIDWGQTLYISGQDDAYETNPFLGPHPTKRAVNTYFILASIIIVKTSYLLPEKLGELFLLGVICIEFDYTTENYTAGFKIRF